MAKSKGKFENHKIKECNVIGYISNKNLLLVDFDGFGISFKSDVIPNKTVKVKYIGEIGKKNFSCELIG